MLFSAFRGLAMLAELMSWREDPTSEGRCRKGRIFAADIKRAKFEKVQRQAIVKYLTAKCKSSEGFQFFVWFVW